MMMMRPDSLSRGAVLRRWLLAFASWLLLCVGPAVAEHDLTAITPLPALERLDRNSVTVSGLSSGGFFAHQFHVAYSSLVKGAGIIAGGPYACAQQVPSWLQHYPNPRVTIAQTVCSHVWRERFPAFAFWLPSAPDPEDSVAVIRSEHKRNAIDPPLNLVRARVWLWAGGNDKVVPKETARALKRVYELMGVAGADITLLEEDRANHGMPIEQLAGEGKVPACEVRSPPFLIDCGYDAAKLLLGHLHPDNFSGAPKVATRTRLIRFDQTEFNGAAEANSSMHRFGYAYVPERCGVTSDWSGRCSLHVAFHGCRQSIEAVHDAFYWHGGYNRWAEASNIVVLYPQVAPHSSLNPDGCWDWWGYTGPDYHRRTGQQMRAVKAMIERLLRN